LILQRQRYFQVEFCQLELFEMNIQSCANPQTICVALRSVYCYCTVKINTNYITSTVAKTTTTTTTITTTITTTTTTTTSTPDTAIIILFIIIIIIIITTLQQY